MTTFRTITIAMVAVASMFGSVATRAETATAAPTIFAAASMKTALDAITAAWKIKTGKSVAISYASSGVLAKQIEGGAPADIFISADLKWMEYLVKAGAIRPGTNENYLGNTLVLIEPADGTSKLKIEKNFALDTALGGSKLAVCTVASCPAGIYGKEALEKLGVWSGIEPKLAQSDNVRAALLLVSRGEAPFGIVYGTDAKAEPKVKVVDTFPESSHAPIVYPVAITKDSKNADAEALIAFMHTPEATGILLGQGFTILGAK